MDVVPPVRVSRFEQIEPGELFLYMDGRHTFYALKTAPPANGDRSKMVLLGPTFIQDVMESFLLEWQPENVLSLVRTIPSFSQPIQPPGP
jgi:hypothetical protein